MSLLRQIQTKFVKAENFQLDYMHVTRSIHGKYETICLFFFLFLVLIVQLIATCLISFPLQLSEMEKQWSGSA